MREREAQLELVRKKLKSEILETASTCSSIEAPLSNIENNSQHTVHDICEPKNIDETDFKSMHSDKTPTQKKSVQKINTTIDSYLKNKRDCENVYGIAKIAPSPPLRSHETSSCTGFLQQKQAIDSSSFGSRVEYGSTKYGLNHNFGESTIFELN